MNTSFSSPGFESNSNFYNLDWRNHSDFSWHAHATENFAPQSYGLHHPEYPQSNNPFSDLSSYDYHPKKSSLEETLKEFMELVGQPTILASQEQSLEDSLEAFKKIINQPCQKIIDATVANTEVVVRLEGQFGHLVAEFNKIEEEEF
jgi:exonuclease VII small subunit